MRDRLHELQRNSSVKLRSKSEEIPIETDTNDKLQELLKEAGEIRGWIDLINDKTQDMKTIYSYSTFSTTPKLQEQMDANIAMCAQLGLKSCRALREFEFRIAKSGSVSAIARITMIQYATMKQLCSDALTNHQIFLTKYKNNRMALLQQQMKLTNQTLTDEECHQLLDTNNISLFVNNYCSDIREAQLTLQSVEIRHQELIKIENALSDVKDMFVQLAVLIDQQQEKINTVEYFATQATDLVDSGTGQIKQGTQYRKKANKKRIMIIACLTIGGIIILGILFS